MRNRVVSIFLLMSLFFNIAHAAVISYADSCDHEKLCEYVMEIEKESQCEDLCEIHHMFHLNAIALTPIPFISGPKHSTKIEYSKNFYISPCLERSYRPPIL